ncbi:MAG: RNA polymerase subunit sigma [Eubacteriales bacterium]|nr:RNA polymerase subunit sigma [Eubacteriales bacterium]MDD4584013.1 RNA polymerase subunit sigma [Eubacteriales bacterium]
MRTTDFNALKAKRDHAYIELFIKEHESFILHIANKTTGRYITKSDDQWSISLSAFHEAIKAYSYTKGAFLPFTEIVIKRRLYDYMKKESKHFCEVPIDSYSIENDEEIENLSVKQEVAERIVNEQNEDGKLEILSLSQTFRIYGFSFFDLISVSPKAMKTKKSCAKAILYLSQNPLLLNEMRRTTMLPLKILEKNLNIPRKILERHRKYIIAGAEIISGDYPILSEYFKFVREEILK